MTIAEALAKARVDPNVAKMSYPEQQLVIKTLVDKLVLQDPAFQQVPNEQKAAVYQELIKKAVVGWTPVLNSFQGELTDDDRRILGANLFRSDVPGTQDSYKRGLYILEQLKKGDQNSVGAARQWLVGNSVTTHSLIAAIATGAKDVIETVFSGDKPFNSLALNSQDYQKLADAMYSQMTPKAAKTSKTLSTVAGIVTQMGEMIALDMLFVGLPGNPPALAKKWPGLFTAKLWKSFETKFAAAKTVGEQVKWGTTVPQLTEAVLSGGVVNLFQDFPRLLETGKIQGKKEFWERVATTFTTGVAFDLLFNIARTVYRYAANPVAKAIKGMSAEDYGMGKLREISKQLDDETVSKIMNDIFIGKVPKELIDQLDPAIRQEAYDALSHIYTILNTKTMDINTPEGFRLLSKAMGFDANITDGGKVVLFDVAHRPLYTFQNRVEAMSFFTKSSLANDILGASLDDILVGAQRGGRVKLYSTTTTKVSELSDTNLYGIFNSALGRDQETASASLRELASRAKVTAKVEFLSEEDFLKILIRTPKKTPFKGTIVLPDRITSESTRKVVYSYLDDLFTKIGVKATPFSVITSLPSVDALNAALSRVGGEVSLGGPSGYQIKLPTGEILNMSDIRSVNTAVWDYLLQSGAVTDNEFGMLINRSTGLSFRKNISSEGAPLYELWGFGEKGKGKLFQMANDLTSLSRWATEYNLKLPDFLMPEFVVRKGKLVVGRTVVTGPVSSLHDFMSNFQSVSHLVPSGTTTKWPAPDGSFMSITYGSSRFFQVEWPSVGLSKVFKSKGDLLEFLGRTGDKYDAIVSIAARKGFQTDVLPNGSIVFHDGVTPFTVRSTEEALQFLRGRPDLGSEVELVKVFGDHVDDEIASKIKAHIDDLTLDPKDFSLQSDIWIKPKKARSALPEAVDAYLMPKQDWFAKMSQELNRPDLMKAYNTTMAMRRVVGGQVNRTVLFLTDLFTDPATQKILPRSERLLVQRLIELDPKLWSEYGPKIAKSLGLAETLTPTQIEIANSLRTYYQNLGKIFKIDFLGFLQNYGPHFRAFNTAEDLEQIVGMTRDQVAQQLFKVTRYADLPELEFLSRNARLQPILKSLHKGDAFEVALQYAEKGYREMYLGPAANQMREVIGSIRASGAKLPDIGYRSFEEFYANLIGGSTDRLGLTVSELSLDITSRISHNLKKISATFGGETKAIGRAIDRLSDNVLSTDLIGDFNRHISFAVLGFRAGRLLTNTAQFVTNTWPIYGKFASEAAEEFTPEKFVEYYQRGIIDDRIFAALGENMAAISQKFRKLALLPSSVSEYLSRGWTALAQEKAFNTALAQFSDNAINWKQFVELARMDWMPTAQLSIIHDLLYAGKIGAARDLALKTAVTELMFDYGKENWPTLFQTTLGRVFGKFGVYPLGQVNFYRSILTQGSMPLRIDRMVRVIAAFTLVKNAFLQLGVDYSGFNITDPLAYTGSPLWNSLIDITRSGSTGPEGSVARRSLMRNWLPFIIGKSNGELTFSPNAPRLLLPGGVQLDYTIRGLETTLTEGASWGALLDLIGLPQAPSSYDGSFQFPW